MRDTLVILDYQREIPPFMQNLIHYADQAFDRILYFTPELRNDNRDACQSTKLQVIQCERSKWRKSLLKSPWYCLSQQVRKQVTLATSNGQKKLDICKQIIRHSVCADTMLQALRPYIISGEIIPSETVIVAAWFSTEAYAVSRIKKEYPEFKTVSFAHSFEINRDQNPVVMYDMNELKHSGIEFLVFISERMRSIYRTEQKKLYPDISDQTWRTLYLGSKKRMLGHVSRESDDGKLRIVSCSSAVEVKRIQLIVNALEAWNQEIELYWTHIGGGPLLEELKVLADRKLSPKKNVTYHFTGALSNEEVQRYYTSNPIDLFINVSAIEGLPVSLMECMSYGIPAVATDVGGTSEIVTNETGFLLQRDFSIQDFLSILVRFYEMKPGKKEKLRQNCLEIWEERFNAEENSKKLFKMIRQQ